MNDIKKIIAIVHPTQIIKAYIHPIKIQAGISFKVVKVGDAKEYEGEYIITPKAYEEQVLDTTDRILRDDVHVLKIPIYEVSNPCGTTINIGG